jgi:hypothetical protein
VAHCLVIIVGLVGLAFLVTFDLGPPLAFNDDWGMAWGARMLINHHRLRVFPEQSALALVQVVWSWLVTFGNTDQRILRLTEVPFVLLGCACLRRISLRLGAPPRWSAVAGVMLLASPLPLAMATSYMTDLPYLGLLLAAALAAVIWLQEGRLLWLVALLAGAATLQRQVGASIPIAVTVVFFMRFRQQATSRRDWIWLLMLWLCVIAAATMPNLTGLAPPTQANRLSGMGHLDVGNSLTAALFLPAMIGLLLSPFVGAALSQRTWVAGLAGNRNRVVLAIVAIVPLLVSALVFQRLVIGYVFDERQIGPLSVSQALQKPAALPVPAALVLDLLVIASYTVFVWVRRDLWRSRSRPSGELLLLLLAACQFVPILLLQTRPHDRYYLPVVAVLWPLVASTCGRTKGTAAITWALVVLASGVALYAVEEQDYQAWQAARDAAARIAYRDTPPSRVDAGYEANAVYLDIPVYEAVGTLTTGLAAGSTDLGLALSGPPNPDRVLAFSCQSDPRPGVSYWSISPGRIVILDRVHPRSYSCPP